MFRGLSPTTARWRPLDGEGLEHLSIGPHDGGIRAASVLIGERGGRPYGVRYIIDCNADWAVLSFSIETTDGVRLALSSDGNGHWRNEAGIPLPQFEGCIDIDLAGTPFTNSLPIRRLGLQPQDGTVKLDMLYVPFDSFKPLRDSQRYTCLVEDRLYRYEAEDRSFTAELPLDEDGLVTDYPTLFKRL
ncbi:MULTISPECIES: putative glycolipid-binding domain-containing protein [unclassified Rhizobium]|uniref:putative glycolipid-binding domain-containing protein n=1 Tax=unclassified Rhizobium TaxID=2613769 RepID=UPI0006FA2F75|nr:MULTISPECIES: putative glycolipid-binding domain-containing protein [unclassified Rhizobium]KQV35117.1 transcriptional regulator [Rhizobium sp. Root1212]KRD24922.1 transcriptional regulator [Rhizobium sp. Root268]